MITATVIALGRTHSTAPSRIASARMDPLTVRNAGLLARCDRVL
jgi:hypothetical protein